MGRNRKSKKPTCAVSSRETLEPDPFSRMHGFEVDKDWEGILRQSLSGQPCDPT
jgi:hypothetical protein